MIRVGSLTWKIFAGASSPGKIWMCILDAASSFDLCNIRTAFYGHGNEDMMSNLQLKVKQM